MILTFQTVLFEDNKIGKDGSSQEELEQFGKNQSIFSIITDVSFRTTLILKASDDKKLWKIYFNIKFIAPKITNKSFNFFKLKVFPKVATR